MHGPLNVNFTFYSNVPISGPVTIKLKRDIKKIPINSIY